MQSETGNEFDWTEEDELTGNIYLVKGGKTTKTVYVQYVDNSTDGRGAQTNEIIQCAFNVFHVPSIRNYNKRILVETDFDGDERYIEIYVAPEYVYDFTNALIHAWNKARS